jgi:hypothetical protein
MAAITAAKNLLVKFARTTSILKSSKLGTSMQLLDVEQLVTFPILKNIAAAGAYRKVRVLHLAWRVSQLV